VPQISDDKYEKLVASALSELRSATDITQLAPGAKARALLEIVSRETGNLYNSFSIELMQTFARYATGANLDLIGELVGVRRRQANRNTITAQSKIQKFYVDNGVFDSINGGAPFIIPTGTEIRTTSTNANDPAIVYITTTDTTCGLGMSEAFAGIKSVEFGVNANIGAGTLTIHNFAGYTDVSNNSLKTTNVDGIIYAESQETDANFRYRVVNQALVGEAANITAIRIASLSVPGVADVYLDRFSRGIGTGAVYVKAITPEPSEFLLLSVQNEIDTAHAFGNLIEARAPKSVGVEVVVKLHLYQAIPQLEQDNLKARVREQMFRFINGLDINETFELADLVRVVTSTDPNIRSIGTPQQPFNLVMIYKYSAADDKRIGREINYALGKYETRAYERVIVETSTLPDNRDPLRVEIG